ncbi:MAG: ribosome maturation factor RimM [Oscillatoriales cyanobacterium SM2_2_1]|nr:ribosome maturation factor RimM [Oscillatoriales cyanobacterium SM2_2_1]
MIYGSDVIVIGKVVAVFGIKGEVKVYSLSDFPERFEVPGRRWLRRSPDGALQPMDLIRGRAMAAKPNVFLVQWAGVDTRTAAQELLGTEVLVESGDRPPLAADEYYVPDLIGCMVWNQRSGTGVGVVVSVIPAGNDLLEVRVAGQEQTILIPFVPAIVPVVDVVSRRLEIDPPPGLLGEV